MGIPLTFNLASQAVDFAIVEWRERMIGAIDQVETPTVINQQAKAAAWFSFGFSAANTLFPAYGPSWLADGVAGQTFRHVLSRIALPVWAMSEVQKAFVNRNVEQFRVANATLFERQHYAKDQIVNEVGTLARGFANSEQGRRYANALVRHFQGRTFDDDRQAEHEARRLLVAARLVTIDRAALRTIVQEGFAQVSNKIGRIFNASPAAPHGFFDLSLRPRLFFAASGDMMWARYMDGTARTTWANRVEVTKQSDALWLMANAHRMEVQVGSAVFAQSAPARTPITTVINQYPNRRLEDYVPSFDASEDEIMRALNGAGSEQSVA